MQIKQAMLMAAGLGKRLQPFTEICPKALLPVMGIPVAQYPVDSLVSAGVTKFVANFHHLPKVAEKGLKALDFGPEARLILSDESSELLGSGGAYTKASRHFDSGPFFLANADVISDLDWGALADRHNALREKKGVTMTLAILSKPPTDSQYTEILFDSKEGLITGLNPNQKGKPFFISAAVIEPEAFSHLPLNTPNDFLPKILLPAIAKKQAGFFITDGLWIDIGDTALWLRAHLSLMERMQRGDLHSKSSLKWRNRIHSINQEISFGIWLSREQAVPDTEFWQAPCYWNSRDSAFPPGNLGPRAVLYGENPTVNSFTDGIGFAEKWVSV